MLLVLSIGCGVLDDNHSGSRSSRNDHEPIGIRNIRLVIQVATIDRNNSGRATALWQHIFTSYCRSGQIFIPPTMTVTLLGTPAGCCNKHQPVDSSAGFGDLDTSSYRN